MNENDLKYLEDRGAEITKMIQREQVKDLKIFVGEDYQRHFDEVYDRIHERGYGFVAFLSTNMQTNGGYIARLHLERLVPQEIFSKPIEKRTCPYGAWFDWIIGIKPDAVAIRVTRAIIDPTKTEDGNIFLKDTIEDVLQVKPGRELMQTFRKETFNALAQLRDFSHLNPEPPILQRNDKDYAMFVKSMWKDYGD